MTDSVNASMTEPAGEQVSPVQFCALWKAAWQSIRGNFGLAFLVILLAGIISYAVKSAASVLPAFTVYTDCPEPVQIALSVGIGIIAEICLLPLEWGVKLFFLRRAKGEKGGVAALFEPYKHFWHCFWVSFCVGCLIFGSTLLLIIPGIVVAYRYMLTPFIALEHPDWSVEEVLAESRRLMRGYKAKAFGYSLLWGLILLLGGVCTLGIGMIWLIPLCNAFFAKFYVTVKAAPPQPETLYRCGTLTYTKFGLINLFIWMLWGDFCYTMMEQLVPTLMPIVLNHHKASNLTIGLLVGSIPALLNFIINPIVSTSSDRTRTRWGRRIPYLLFTSPFVVLFLVLVGWADQIGAWAYHMVNGPDGSPATVIIVMIGIFGVGFQVFNLFVSSVFYYIFADVVPKTLVGRFMALFRVVGTGAGVVFSKWVLPLADKQEYIPWIFTGVAIVYLLSFTSMCIKVKEGEYPPPEKIEKPSFFGVIGKYFKECFSIPFYQLLFIGLAINVTSNTCRTMFNLLFAKEELGLTMEQYGGIFAAINVVMLIAYIPLGWIVDKFHPLRIFILGGFLIIIANVFGFFWCNDYKTFYVVSFLIAATYVLQGASSLPMTVRLFPSEKYGQFCSADAMVTSITLIIANAGGGAFIDAFGYRYIFVWDFIFTVIATALLIIVYFMWKRYGGDKNYVAPQRKVNL